MIDELADPTPIDDADPTPIDDADPTPIDDADPTPIDDADPTPIDDSIMMDFHHAASKLVRCAQFRDMEMEDRFRRDVGR